MKKDIKIAYTVRNICTGQSNNLEKERNLNKKWILNKAIYIETIVEYAVEVKRIIKLILKSPS